MARRKPARKPPVAAPRSTKAGEPASEPVSPEQVRRRRPSARTAVRKDTMVLQAADGPRVLWGRTKPKVKKR